MGARRKKARASANRCHSPALSSAPLENHFPRGVSYPWGKPRMISSAPATRAAALMSTGSGQHVSGGVAQGNALGDSGVESNRFLEKNGHLLA